MMRLTKRFSAPLLFFMLAGCAIGLSIYKPYHNWDMIGYIASAKSFEQRDVESLHSFTYEQLRNSVSDAEYEELVQAKEGSEYRYSIATAPSAFREQLPFFQIRPVYTGIIFLLYKTGVNIVFATHLISGLAVVIAVVFLYLMSVSFLARLFIYALPPLAIIFGVLDIARYSTPDGLGFLAVIISVYLYLKKRTSLLLILLPTMLGIRTDLILFTIPLLVAISVFEKINRWHAALSLFASVAIYMGIGTYASNPGWSTIFYFTLVQNLTHPISMPPTLTVQEYFYALFNGTKDLVNNKSFLLYILLAVYSLYLIKVRAKTTSVVIALISPSALIAVICLIYVGSHYLAFPVVWDRFFSGPYIIGAFSLLFMITDYTRVLKPAQSGRGE